MYLLKKVIQLREKSHPDHEKPFLDHIEDLRVMITRIVITLIIAMGGCFVYNAEIMAFFRKPVDEVMRKQLEATLPENAPKPLTTELWKAALKLETSISSLNPPEREIFLKTLNDPNLAFHASSITLLRAAMALPEAQRENFITALDQDPILKSQVKSLLKTHPKTDTHTQGNLNMMSALRPTEGFMLSMKLSFVAGIVVSFPLLLLFILQFILPGLHSHEKRVLWPSMIIGFGLFLAGSAFAYYLVLPKALLFFYTWSGDMGISNDWRIGEYISFATQFTLLFGASFELPVVVMVFVKLGLLTYDTMSRTRSYAILAIFVAAAILTPTPDIPTMLLMATPMIVLYEICIWLAYFDQKKNRLKEETEARERIERMLAAEEKRQQEQALNPDSEDTAEDRHHDYDSSDDHHDPHSHRSGDDGWHDEIPQTDPYAPYDDTTPEARLPDEIPPPDEPNPRKDP